MYIYIYIYIYIIYTYTCVYQCKMDYNKLFKSAQYPGLVRA